MPLAGIESAAAWPWPAMRTVICWLGRRIWTILLLQAEVDRGSCVRRKWFEPSVGEAVTAPCQEQQARPPF